LCRTDLTVRVFCVHGYTTGKQSVGTQFLTVRVFCVHGYTTGKQSVGTQFLTVRVLATPSHGRAIDTTNTWYRTQMAKEPLNSLYVRNEKALRFVFEGY